MCFNEVRDDRQFLSAAQASRYANNVCESHLRVVNTVLSEAAAGSSSRPDVVVVQIETDLSGSVMLCDVGIETYLSLLLGHTAWHLLNWRKSWHM